MPKIKVFYLFKFLKSTERSETIILGILGTLDILGISHLGILGTFLFGVLQCRLDKIPEQGVGVLGSGFKLRMKLAP